MGRTASDTGLKVIDRGEGSPTLVFLHHFGGSGRTWDEVVERLERSFRCLAPDLRGFGDSKAELGSDYSLGDAADDMAEAIRAAGVRHYVLIGHSMGGKVALLLAARKPPGLEALVLVAPSPPTPEPMEESERQKLLASHGSRAVAEETVGKITAHPLRPTLRERAVADIVRSSCTAWDWWLERGSRKDISAETAGINVPTLVVSGGRDPVVPPDRLAREVVARIAGARMAVVPDAGHLLPLEAPGTVSELIRESVAAVRQVVRKEGGI